MVEGEKSLIILSSLLLDNLFTNKALVILCTLEGKKQIQLTFLLDTGAIGIAFIDKAIACTVCEVLKISFIKLENQNHSKDFTVN